MQCRLRYRAESGLPGEVSHGGQHQQPVSQVRHRFYFMFLQSASVGRLLARMLESDTEAMDYQ